MIVAMMIVVVGALVGFFRWALAVSISCKPRGLYRNFVPAAADASQAEGRGFDPIARRRSPATAGFLFHRRC